MYVGNGSGRAAIREHEFYFPTSYSLPAPVATSPAPDKPKSKQKAKGQAGSGKQHKGGGGGDKQQHVSLEGVPRQQRVRFDVLLTSYEMVNMDFQHLRGVEWACLIVDEGHRLKTKDSRLFQSLQQYKTRHRVLLTGTPLQVGRKGRRRGRAGFSVVLQQPEVL